MRHQWTLLKRHPEDDLQGLQQCIGCALRHEGLTAANRAGCTCAHLQSAGVQRSRPPPQATDHSAADQGHVRAFVCVREGEARVRSDSDSDSDSSGCPFATQSRERTWPGDSSYWVGHWRWSLAGSGGGRTCLQRCEHEVCASRLLAPRLRVYLLERHRRFAERCRACGRRRGRVRSRSRGGLRAPRVS